MNLCKKGISDMKEGISIKENKSLNEFLNIRKIEDNFLYTLDKQVISFYKSTPNKYGIIFRRGTYTKNE